MKKVILFLFVAFFLGSQSINAESYQRWVYWVNEPSHQVTATELAEITVALYNGLVLPDTVYKLNSGITYRIPQPKLFLVYVEKAVRSARPSANTTQKVVDAIAGAEKMKWDNNISVKVRNYYFSTLNKKVQHIDNYSGEGKDTDFLFIDSNPSFKCDCVNALEIIIDLLYKPVENISLKVITPKQEDVPFITPRNILEEKTKITGYEIPATNKEKREKGWFAKNWWWVVPVSALIVGGSIYGVKQISKDKNVSPVIPEVKPGYPVDAQPQGKGISIPLKLWK